MTGEEIGEKLGLTSHGGIMYELWSEKDYDVSKLIPKVTIPKFVAEYTDYCKSDGYGVGTAMQPEYMTDGMPDEVDRWLTDNSQCINIKHEYLFARAWLDGYEIEPEDKFVLPMEGTHGADSTTMYAIKIGGYWTANKYYDNMRAALPTVTQTQIDDAPEWVKVVAKNKVKVDEEN